MRLSNVFGNNFNSPLLLPTLIRNAIQKLEFYGLLKSMPQSGTFIADLGLTAINGMIDQIINLPTPDFKSLVETRIFLELKLESSLEITRKLGY